MVTVRALFQYAGRLTLDGDGELARHGLSLRGTDRSGNGHVKRLPLASPCRAVRLSLACRSPTMDNRVPFVDEAALRCRRATVGAPSIGWLADGPHRLCSVAAVGICLERLWTLNAHRAAPEHLLADVRRELERGDVDLARLGELCAASYLGAIFLAGLRSGQRGREAMKESMEETASAVVHDMERYLTALGTIASISPLLGLLGTVVGMIRVFAALVDTGIGNPGIFAGGISEAPGHHRGGVGGGDSRPHLPSLSAAQGRRPRGDHGTAVRPSDGSGPSQRRWRPAMKFRRSGRTGVAWRRWRSRR